MSDRRAREVLDFWFDASLDAAQRNKRWFGKDASFDAEIRRSFLALYEEAAAGRLGAWQSSARDCLALVKQGDSITIDTKKRLIQLNVPAKELAARRKKWKAPKPRYTRGLLAKYMRLVSTASLGAITDSET